MRRRDAERFPYFRTRAGSAASEAWLFENAMIAGSFNGRLKKSSDRDPSEKKRWE